jgi:hypothetical protein
MTVDAAVLVEALGWLATAIFIGSYFFSRPELLVRAQMIGGVLWVAYGVLVQAKPVVAANALVVAAAAWKTWRSPTRPGPGRSSARAPAAPAGHLRGCRSNR